MEEKKEPQEVEIKYDAPGDREFPVEIKEPASPEVQEQFDKIWETQ